MNENLFKEPLQIELEQLATIKECPRLYLANYFADLKANVDI